MSGQKGTSRRRGLSKRAKAVEATPSVDSHSLTRAVVICLLVVIAGLAAYRVFGLLESRHFDPDEFEHIQAAWFTSNGLVIYRDFFEHHPPLVYLLLAPFLRAPDAVDRLVDARMVMVPFALAIVWLVGAIAARLGNILSGALAAALVSTVVIFQQKSIEVRPDVPAIAFLLLAILVCVAPKLSTWRLAAAGFAFGIALLFTPKILFAHLLWPLRPGGRRRADHAFVHPRLWQPGLCCRWLVQAHIFFCNTP